MNTKKIAYLLILSFCNCFLASYCPHKVCHAAHNWSDGGNNISVSIVKEYLQSWHEVGRPVELRAEASDPDTEYCPCESSYPSHSGTRYNNLTYSWTGTYVLSPTNLSTILWKAIDYTPVQGMDTIQVEVDDVAILNDECDTGELDDTAATASLALGGWQTKASLVVSGTNMSTPQTVTAYELEYYDYSDFQVLDEPMKNIEISLNSSHILLGFYADDTVISPNPGSVTLTPITTQATWTLSCIPANVDGGPAWNADVEGFVHCFVNRVIDGDIISNVWDNDADLNALSCDISVTVQPPGSPIGINIDPDFELGSDEARSQVAIGFGYQSDVAFPDTSFKGKAEHKDDSNAHSYSGENPYIKTTSLDAGTAGKDNAKHWVVDRDGDLTAQMQSSTEGGIEGVESKINVEGQWLYNEMFIHAWQQGTLTYEVGYPYYRGTPNDNPSWSW